MSTHALYRFFDEAGDLLYVGITMNPASRWKQHSTDKHWWTSVANITIEPHRDRHSVLEAERLSIVTEHPRYNVMHNQRMVSRQVTWTCTGCEGEIDDLEGYLRLSFEDLFCDGGEDLDWSAPDRKFALRGMGALPGKAIWSCVHGDCDETPDADGYYIDVHRIRTPKAVLAWTLHIASKGWLDNTDWASIVRPIAGELPA